MIEHGVDKVEIQPLVQDPTFIDPADDDSDGPAAQGFLLAVWCDAPPSDGDIAAFVAANNRFELTPQTTTAAPSFAWLYMTTIDGTGATVLLLDDDGNPIPSYVPVS